MNKVVLIGRLTRDPELRYTGTGNAVASFALAVDRPFKNQQGERDTDFIRIVTWRKLAELCANNLGKGRLVAVEGRLQIRNYEDKEGVRKQAAEVVADSVTFLDWPKDKERNSGSNDFEDSGFGDGDIELPDDDVPF